MASTIYTQHTLDHETGDMKTTKWITKKVHSKEHFIRTFLQDLKSLKKLTNADFRILFHLIVFLEYNTNEFFLNKERRETLCEICDMKPSTINQAIARLVKKNLLIKISSFTYQMNPKIFFNGEELQRTNILEVILRYTICEDC